MSDSVPGREFQPPDRAGWRAWLHKNHRKSDEVWLVLYKKHTGKQSVSYRESVEEALCFGWIDGKKRSIDDERYAYRFTPRKPGSKWSPLNIELATRLQREGRMTKAGLAAFEAREAYDEETLKQLAASEVALTPALERAIRKNKRAWKNFNDLAPGYRKRYVRWLLDAKREATRERRLVEAIRLLENNEKLGMK